MTTKFQGMVTGSTVVDNPAWDEWYRTVPLWPYRLVPSRLPPCILRRALSAVARFASLSMVGEEPHETVLVEMDFKCVVWGKKSVVGDSVEFRVAGEKMDECDFRNMFGWEAQDHIDVLETDGVKQWREQR